MSAYTTQANLETRYDKRLLAGLADDLSAAPRSESEAVSSLATSNAIAVIAQAIADASSVIDTELLGHADMADADVLSKIEPLCSDITMYYLCRRRYVEENSNPWLTPYKAAMQTFNDIRSRKRKFDISPDQAPSIATSTTASNTRKISTDTMSNYV